MKGLCFIVNFLLFSLEAFSCSFYEGAESQVAEFAGHLAEIAKLPTGQILLNQLEEIWKAKNEKLNIVHEEGKSLQFYGTFKFEVQPLSSKKNRETEDAKPKHFLGLMLSF